MTSAYKFRPAFDTFQSVRDEWWKKRDASLHSCVLAVTDPGQSLELMYIRK
jgi:hypothetical protein